VLGTDPLHEMPIIDLRLRKAMRLGDAKLAVASERPTMLDGGAVETVRYAPGDAAGFVRALAGALGAEGYEHDPKGPHGSDAAAVAEVLNAGPDTVIVWGSRLWRSPGAVEALRDCARALGMHKRIGPGMLEIPEESNARGLREVGCLPAAGPGYAPTAASGRDAAGIKDGLASGELDTLLLIGADPVRTHPDSAGWRKALASSFVVSVAMHDDESTAHANIVLPAESHAEKEGTVTHPEGRLQRLRPNVPHPDATRPTWWALNEVLLRLGLDLNVGTPEEVFARLAGEVPFYGSITYEEIGGLGMRWQERDPGTSWTPRAGAGATASDADSPSAAYASESAPPATTADGQDGLLLGTYRDLWATEVTNRNPSLRFLMPEQKLDVSPEDAAELGVTNGEPVTVSVNGDSVEARVRIRERMLAGSAFLIEGTDEGNGNVLANGAPRRVQVSKR
jgi:NADH-quinone oxidoreductase subunit G